MRFRLTMPLLLLFALGCDGSFNPKGPYVTRVVAYSVLSPPSEMHFVRLFTTYDPPGFDPYANTTSNQVVNAQVTISERSNTFSLRDTTLPRTETGRYADSIHAFVLSPVSIVRGRTYALTVNAPGFGVLTGSTVIPPSGVVEFDLDARPILFDPLGYRGDIVIYGTPGTTGVGYAFRLFLEYEVFSVDTVVKLEEVPVQITNDRGCVTFDAIYPGVRRRTASFGREFQVFPNQMYRRTIIRIKKLHEGKTVNFRRAVVVMAQADRHLYTYYSQVNGFRDEYSIRVDLPNYTNIQGGLGVFGSFASDSLFYSLQTAFPNLQCSE